jgi:nitrite reductase/ring-hydroxylating ferredoxin subunit
MSEGFVSRGFGGRRRRSSRQAWRGPLSRPTARLSGRSDTCTHRGGPLNEGERESNVVMYHWHGSQFDLCSGEVLRGPSREPQQHFEARLREGKIEVRSP